MADAEKAFWPYAVSGGLHPCLTALVHRFSPPYPRPQQLLSSLSALVFFLFNCPWPFSWFCAHAARSPATSRFFLVRLALPESVLLTASSAGPWAACLSCLLVSLRMQAFYHKILACRALEPQDGLTPGQIQAAAVIMMSLAGLALGSALDRCRRAHFKSGKVLCKVACCQGNGQDSSERKSGGVPAIGGSASGEGKKGL